MPPTRLVSTHGYTIGATQDAFARYLAALDFRSILFDVNARTAPLRHEDAPEELSRPFRDPDRKAAGRVDLHGLSFAKKLDTFDKVIGRDCERFSP
jgi:hypothetical protein